MSGDYSRFTFDPWQDDFGVLLQQGRPLSDAEWNSLTLQLRRRIHAGTLDTIGTAVVPMQTPDGFKPTLAGGKLFLGQGRMYVDGLLAENHGTDPKAWNPRLEELVGTKPVDYDAQPYYPGAPVLPAGGPHLVYLDVWQREVTHIVRPELIEKAVGVDSTTHLQTIWQVKLLHNVGTAVNCSTPLDSIPGWTAANSQSAGRLSIDTASVPGEPDPCLIPPAGGYKGLENQLYRIEIHTPGAPGTATFKWSRENASIETRITHMPSLSQLRVESVGKDSVLCFSAGDWVEITDDFLELSNQPGQLRRIKIGDGVDDAMRTILLEKPLLAGVFPVDAQGRTQPGRHMRIKRWDHQGKVRDKNGIDLQDLDLAASTGEIVVPATVGVSVLLEHGIIATFSLDPAGGTFRSGDYWIVAARTSDASVEVLDKAPPRGIHHHYAKLGIVTFPGSISDCRTFWPPPVSDTGGGDKIDACACTICVTPEQHASGEMTIQKAIDEVRSRGGGTVCLEIGNYSLKEALKIESAQSLRLVGKGIASRLVAISATGAVAIHKSQDIMLETFSILCRGAIEMSEAAISIAASTSVRVDHLSVQVESEDENWAAIILADALMTIDIRHNLLKAPVGIRSGGKPSSGGSAGLADVRVENNEFDCTFAGIAYVAFTLHQMINRISGNCINGCLEAGIQLEGLMVADSGLDIQANSFNVLGHGIVGRINGLRILDNDVFQSEQANFKDQCGIQLLSPTNSDIGEISDCQILGNRIQGFGLAGIFIDAPLRSAMIKQNQVSQVSIGLSFQSTEAMDQVSIANNQFRKIEGMAILGKGKSANYVVSDNTISTGGRESSVILDFGGGDGVLSHNVCYSDGAGDNPDILLNSSTLIVANNRVVGGPVSIKIGAKKGRYTVLGNICRGNINGLTPPWTPLNLEGVA